jgi:two-component system LytT family sensor kinase
MDKNISFLNRVEIWLSSITLGMLIYYLINVINDTGYYNEDIHRYDFESRGMTYSYIGNYFFPFLGRYVVIYCCYLVLHFVVIKNLVLKQQAAKNIILGIFLFSISVVAWALSEYAVTRYLFHHNNYRELTVTNILLKSFTRVFVLYAAYAFYTLIKYNLSLIAHKLNIKITQPDMVRDCTVLIAIWIIMFFMMNMPSVSDGYRIIWLFGVLPGIPLYVYGYVKLIPQVKIKNKGFGYYLLHLALIECPILFLLGGLYLIPIGYTKLYSYLLFAFCDTAIVFAIALLSWFIYHSRIEKNKEITGLQTALGQSTANLDFLRSQINPHFLFNALNTIYATAIQENAGRTGEAVQKLGDMMRFMLQENVQQQIPLMREVDYLNNYIALQKLRTQTSVDIIIQTEIEQQINDLQIAPMLLIPFVENAFKHGISLREPSHIKVTLYTQGTQLFFDVCNSIHQKHENDPEKDRSGIGLENVKQRLELLYPDTHELMIRESAKDFFIHLTLNLN